MSESGAEPVEISIRMRAGEWSEESLETLLGSYQEKLRQMGAADAEILSEVERRDDGSVAVNVSWQRRGAKVVRPGDVHGVPGKDAPMAAAVARGNGERLPAGSVTDDSQGLGSILGDADRSAIDEPPAARTYTTDEAPVAGAAEAFVLYADGEGTARLEESDEANRSNAVATGVAGTGADIESVPDPAVRNTAFPDPALRDGNVADAGAHDTGASLTGDSPAAGHESAAERVKDSVKDAGEKLRRVFKKD